ncbi:MAG: hypothetical protein ACRD0P_03305 [Stackebrandtia sp.]
MTKRRRDAVSRVAALVEWDGSTGGVDVASLEAELGTQLPTDYRFLTETFPYGLFQDWLQLLHPHWMRDSAAFASWIRQWCAIQRDAKASVAPTFPYDFFPDPGGLLPWADINGDIQFYWVARGEPDTWPVVVGDRALGEASDVYSMPTAEFLEALLNGTVAPPILEGFHEALTARPVTFEPI